MAKDLIKHKDAAALEGELSMYGKVRFYYLHPDTRRMAKCFKSSILYSILFLLAMYLTEGRVWKLKNGFMEADAVASVGVGLIGIFIATYWNLDTVFGKKWSYLAELLNKANSEQCNLKSAYLKVMFAMDSLDMKLWNHDSFSHAFQWQVKLAVVHAAKIKGRDPQDVWNKGILCHSEIEEILSIRKNALYYQIFDDETSQQDLSHSIPDQDQVVLATRSP